MEIHDAILIFRRELKDLSRQASAMISLPFFMLISALIACAYLTPKLKSATNVVPTADNPGVATVIKVAIQGDRKAIENCLQDRKKFEIVELKDGDIERALKDQTVDIVAEVGPGFDEAIQKVQPAKAIPHVLLHYDLGRLTTTLYADQVTTALDKVRDRIEAERIQALGLKDPWRTDIEIKYATPDIGESSKPQLCRTIPFFIIFIVSVISASFGGYLISDEREQGTLLLLFAQPVTRFSIGLGKLMMSVFMTALCLTLGYGLLVGLLQVESQAGPVPGFAIDPTELHLSSAAAWACLLMSLPLVLMLSAGSMWLATCFRTSRESVTFSYLMVFAAEMLASAILLPGVLASPALALIPVSGTAIACFGILQGQWSLSAVIFAIVVPIIFAVLFLFLVVRNLEREQILFGKTATARI